MMFNITIIDDADVEGSEYFFVNASTLETQTAFIINSARVRIVDNNGNPPSV